MTLSLLWCIIYTNNKKPQIYALLALCEVNLSVTVFIAVMVVFAVTCDPGMEAKGGDTCNPCQANFYKDTVGVQDCSACPGASTTEGVSAATDINQCIGKCTYRYQKMKYKWWLYITETSIS